MRIEPDQKYSEIPCSYASLYIAMDVFRKTDPKPVVPDGTSYLTLDAADRLFKKYFPRARRYYYNKDNRVILNLFLQTNNQKVIICVKGHYLFANGRNYYSFFDNNLDEIIGIWYLQ